MTAFCAICTSESGPFQSVSVNGRNVNACARCCDEHPRAGGYTFGGGKPSATGVGGDGNRRMRARGNR